MCIRDSGCTDQCCKREENPCQPRAVHTWHIASFRCAAKLVAYWTNNGQRLALGPDGSAAIDPKQTSGLINVRGGLFDIDQLPSDREAQSFKDSTNDKACSGGPYAPPRVHHASRRRGGRVAGHGAGAAA